jgi:hypothetical protein
VSVTVELFGTRTPPPVTVVVAALAADDRVRVLRELTGHSPAVVRGTSTPVPPAGAGPAGNRAANPTLAVDDVGWFTRWYGTTGAGSTTRSTAAARTGTHGYRKTWTAGAGASSSDTGVAYGSTGSSGDPFAVTPGSLLRMGVWLRSSRATTVRAVALWYTAAGALVGSAVIGPSTTAPAATWVRAELTATVPATAARLYLIGGPRYVDAGTAPAAWQAGDTLDADDVEVVDVSGVVVVQDVEPPVGRPLVYVAEVTAADGTTRQVSAGTLTVPDPGRHVLSDPATGSGVLVDVVADEDTRTTELRASTLHPAGRARPVVLVDTRSSDVGVLTAYTRDAAETTALLALLAAGAPVTSRPTVATPDLPPVETLALTGVTRARRTRAGDRVWALPFVVVDPPDPTLPVTLVDLSDVAAYYTGATLATLAVDFPGTLLDVARFDFGTG